MNWIRFVRQYGPIARNDNMYDEAIQRAARRGRVQPIKFEHPVEKRVLALFEPSREPVSVILTGTPGDGKTHLCRLVWQKLNGSSASLDEPYVQKEIDFGERRFTLHILKDLSEFAPQSGREWDPAKAGLLHKFCRSIFEPNSRDIFLLAANDGQLIESWRRLEDDEYVVRARKLFETLLVENRQSASEARLEFFNLSRGSSAEVFDLALDAFLAHPGWSECRTDHPGELDFFGPNCPIRHNFELLQTPLVQQRLRALLELCDFNDLHIPIRQVLLLLTNGVLGHPDVGNWLMVPEDVPGIVRERTISKASLYNNLFGGNLPENRREAITIFDYLDRFRIGHETTNRIDNILIFGDADDSLRGYFDRLLRQDRFYGADESYRGAQREYIEGANEEAVTSDFLGLLIAKRRGLFFGIPDSDAEELGLWEMTVFKYAGEYLKKIVGALRAGRTVEHPILARIVKGLNRIFVGMLVSSDRELLLGTSAWYSSAKVSRLLEERVSVRPRLSERVEIELHGGMPVLRVSLSDWITCRLELHLVRFEFLSRVAEGALPSSFSRECYEDILAFKSRLLAGIAERQPDRGREPGQPLSLRLLHLDEAGNPVEELIEVVRG
jgi:Cdc6-like AAA superfamily ATPase